MIINNDCLMALKELPENSVDAIVTDPPYGLSFMGKKWDYDVPSTEIWSECLRVLKPGGYLLAFAGTRTQHRMAVRIEDAGFEIRDMIAWIYASGFPKSLNIGKVMDKFIKTGNASWNGTGDSSKGALGYSKLQHQQDYRPEDYSNRHQNKSEITEDKAKEWEGWGTALKPALEPITVARKPISEKSVAENCLKWGVGGINIDGSRVDTEDKLSIHKGNLFHGNSGIDTQESFQTESQSLGRFPANLIHDGSEEVLELFPNVKTGAVKPYITTHEPENTVASFSKGMGKGNLRDFTQESSSGSAARFFYCAKAPVNQRWSYLTCNCQTVKLDTWQKQDQNQKEKTAGTSPEVDISENYITEDSDSNMTLFGNNTMDQSHQNTTSTTLMETNSTTTSQTSNLSHQQNTSESMEDVNLKMGNGINHVNSVQSENQLQQISGTSQKKDGHSTGVAVPATLAKLYTKSVCEKCGSQVRNTAHPTQKPIKLMEYLVNLVSKEGHTVLDPFLGSGTTAIACKNLNRNCIGIERDAEYVKISEARISAVK